MWPQLSGFYGTVIIFRQNLFAGFSYVHHKEKLYVILVLFYPSAGCPFVVECLLWHRPWLCSAVIDCLECIQWLWYLLLVLFPGQLAAGTCEIVTLDRDSSQPRRTIARQTARCACKKGQIAGTTRARPACVDGKKQRSIQSVSANTRVV